jgi:hypothetical protein
MTARAFYPQAILGIALALVIGAPAGADPTPDASAAPSPTPTPSATVAPAASPSAASLQTPAPTDTGEYKEQLKMAALATSLLLQAQTGEIDRTMLEPKMDLALTPAMVQNLAQQLQPLGKPKSISFVSRTLAGAYTAYKYRIVWADVSADESFALNADGKIVAWRFQPAT